MNDRGTGTVDIATTMRKSKPGFTYYGYRFGCGETVEYHGHDMYGRCLKPATRSEVELLLENIDRSLLSDARSYARGTCRTCRLAIVRSGPRGGWEHVNTKKQGHKAMFSTRGLPAGEARR